MEASSRAFGSPSTREGSTGEGIEWFVKGTPGDRGVVAFPSSKRTTTNARRERLQDYKP